mmetsp:Transcript_112349/g.312285  ORF Transcript_112349/g.312285 Transcript_112349/m.312285 type:complete len:280 (-) Transcript_112349:33-872(-)
MTSLIVHGPGNSIETSNDWSSSRKDRTLVRARSKAASDGDAARIGSSKGTDVSSKGSSRPVLGLRDNTLGNHRLFVDSRLAGLNECTGAADIKAPEGAQESSILESSGTTGILDCRRGASSPTSAALINCENVPDASGLSTGCSCSVGISWCANAWWLFGKYDELPIADDIVGRDDNRKLDEAPMWYEYPPCSCKPESSVTEELPSVMMDSTKPGGEEEAWEAAISSFPFGEHLSLFLLSGDADNFLDADISCVIVFSSKRCNGRVVSDNAKGGASSSS